jgi:predicted peptidase
MMLCFAAGCSSGGASLTVPIEPTRFQAVFASAALNSYVYVPEAYSDTGEFQPLIVYLHGYNEQGTSHDGLTGLIEEGNSYPFIILSPQCFSNWKKFDVVESLFSHLTEFCNTYRVDRTRIYLTGFSMGGDGVWSLSCAYPELFAAIAPVSSFGYSGTVECLKDVPAWIFHGTDDAVVPSSCSQRMYDMMMQYNENTMLTFLQGTSHQGAKITAYRSQALYAWFLSHGKISL